VEDHGRGSIGIFSLCGHRDRVSDECADDRHQDHRDNENAIRDPFPVMQSALRAKAKCGIGKKTGQEEQKSIAGKKIVRQSIRLAQRDNDTNKADDRQTNADHPRGNGKNVDGNIFFKMILRSGVHK
jgi:hypothetical protein